MLDVAEELGADVAAPAAEELGPLALGAVDALELLGVGDLVAEDERDHASVLRRRSMRGPYRFASRWQRR